jgi:cyclophilin family peptidyl-prolyl cis-trans isomerase
VGTEKRERQKAGRQNRRVEAEVAARKARTRGAFVKWGIFAAVILAIIVGFAFFTSDDDDDPDTVTTDSSTSAAPTTTAEPTACPPTDGSATQTREFSAPFADCLEAGKTYTAVITTSAGELRVALDAEKAPKTVNNFVALSRYKYYDGISCHRIIPDFVAQCGDPEGTGSGGPGYEFEDELPEAGEYQVGSLAMANSGPNTNGSQFFVITGEQGATLDPNYSLFGQAEPGQDDVIAALDALGNDDPNANGVPPKEPVTIESVVIEES